MRGGHARLLRHLLGQRVGHGLGDQRLAAAGRAVQQHALRRLQAVLLEQLGVQERQLHGVADLLDLLGQPADVLVGDVGDLLEDGLFDLLPGEPLQRVGGPGVEQHRVGRTDRAGETRRPESAQHQVPRERGTPAIL